MGEVATKSVVVERTMAHPPEKVWRALTTSDLMARWLMPNDFQAVAGRAFNLRVAPMPHWNGVVDCQVLALEPPTRLSYSWNTTGEDGAEGLRTTVTWTLTPQGDGATHVRMEHAGFRPQDETNYQGAVYGARKFIVGLEQVAASL